MSDVLDQSEIDALLAAVSADLGHPGEDAAAGFSASAAPRKEIDAYDFKRPERVSKDQMRALLSIHESFARSFGATDEEAARNARLELAVQMYREGKWSTGKAAQFVGLTRIAFMDLLRDRKVEMPYTQEMVEEDFRYAQRGS